MSDCPECARLHEVLRELEERHKKTVEQLKDMRMTLQSLIFVARTAYSGHSAFYVRDGEVIRY